MVCYVNGDGGIEHGFTLATARETVRRVGAFLETPLLPSLGPGRDGVEFLNADGAALLHYGDGIVEQVRDEAAAPAFGLGVVEIDRALREEMDGELKLAETEKHRTRELARVQQHLDDMARMDV